MLDISSSDPIKTKLTQDGLYTWTYVSLLGDMLETAESNYGERDKSYTFLGIEFVDEDIPYIWYRKQGKGVIIRLTSSCINNMNQGCFQLAHECIHLLSPTGSKRANLLEEGLATLYSIVYLRQVLNIKRKFSSLPSYDLARSATEQLLAIDPNAIRTLRAEQPCISDISADLILKHYPQAKPLAYLLAAPFDRSWTPDKIITTSSV